MANGTSNFPQQSSGGNPQPQKSVVKYLHWEGPLPPPQLLQQYRDVAPNAPQLILEAFQKQGNHRRFIEKWMAVSPFLLRISGQIFAFLLVAYGIYKGAHLIEIDKQASGLTAIFTSLGALAGMFIYQRKNPEK